MRTKKLFTLLAAGAIVLSVATKTSAKGGENGRLSIGAELALPMGTFGDESSIGFGGSLRYEMPMGDNLGLTGTVGYLTFSGKDFPDGLGGTYKISNSMIPILFGAKYYLQEQQNGFYVQAQLGITMFHTSFTTPSYTFFGVTVPGTDYSANSSDFTIVPGVGYHLDNLDLGVGYNIVSNTGGSLSYVGVRIAYVLGSK